MASLTDLSLKKKKKKIKYSNWKETNFSLIKKKKKSLGVPWVCWVIVYSRNEVT